MVIPVKGNSYSEQEITAFGLFFYKDLSDIILYTRNRMIFWFLKTSYKLKLLTYYHN